MESLPSPPLSPAAIEEAVLTSPSAYAALLNRLLDDMGAATLRGPAQRIYLQLVRESIGRGSREVRIGFGTLAKLTRFSKMTVISILDVFQEKGLIEVREAATKRQATLYKVNILPRPPREAAISTAASPVEMATRLDDLTANDRRDLETLWGGLSRATRQIYIDQAYEEIALFESRSGAVAPMTSKQIECAARYRFLLQSFGPARLRQSYSKWFSKRSHLNPF